MNAQDARRKTVENSQLFKNIMMEIEQAIEDEKFEITLYDNKDFREWTPLAQAVSNVLREKCFKVDVAQYSYITTISWK
jgi:hypothetical protein